MSKYLLRLLSFSLLIGVLPAVLVGILSYSIASGDIVDKVKEGNMHLLAQTQLSVEQMLKSVEKSATQFANSSIVEASMDESYTVTDFEQIRKLSVELYNLQSSDVVITEAYLINLQHKWALDLNGLKSLDSLNHASEFLDYAKVTRSIQWYTGSVIAGGDDMAVPKETISLVHKIPILPQTDKPQGLVVIRIAASDIWEALSSSNPSDRYYILDHTGTKIVGAAAGESGGYDEINAAVAKRLESEPEERLGLFSMQTGGEEEAVIYRSSGYNGWTYVSVVSIGELTKESRKIAKLTMIVCASVLLMVLAVALFGSRRMYRPIQRLQDIARGLGRNVQMHPSTPRNDELEFIKVSLQSLAFSRDQVEQQLLGHLGHLKEFFVLKLFTDQISENDFFYRSALNGLPTGWAYLGVFALQIDNLQDTRYEEEDRELLLYAVNNIAEEVLPPSSRFTPIILNQTQVTIVVADKTDPAEVKRVLYEAAERIKRNSWEYLHLQVSIGISKPYRMLTDTVKAYGESLSALKTRISLGPDIIVHYEDVENNHGVDHYEHSHLKVLEERLVYSLREMQPNNVSEIFRQYLDALLPKDGYLHEHQLLLMQLVSRLLYILQDQGISLKKVLQDEGAVKRLMYLQTRDEIVHWFESVLFAPMIQVLSEKSETTYIKIADRIVRMIQENYDQEISLESYAQELNYHPVYLSRVFKREIGMTFSDYLSEYRMRMAKVMLETTDKKISEIGEQLQYKNISAFIRTFRKLYDMTPGQYREKIMKGSTE
ncbi:AraC family transcriptional regulator [Paenibacillus harenae]|uniref:AraC family transcriptional regulator n=1 Tax=Paenibacillus harenae TaxID=306543 RepID=UPI00278E3EA8|nr:AraC family transcriptional regulator [Paenibacillus harenae]MDQ0062502.1 AraC-like DNA-binding protein [Paenibacillus harenae]